MIRCCGSSASVWASLRNLQARREEISSSLKKLEKWTEELQAALDNATTMGQLEDIYRPYKPKRRTRAMIAKEKGLEPLGGHACCFSSPRRRPPRSSPRAF